VIGVGIGVGVRSWKIGLFVAALGALQWLFVSRSRWLFDKIAGSVTLIDESGLKTTVLGTWPLGDFSAVVSRHRVTEYSDGTSHRYDLALLHRSGTERPLFSFPSPQPARDLAAFLGLPLEEPGPLDGDARVAPIADAMPAALRALWEKEGLRSFTRPGDAASFLRDYVHAHPDDPTALELLGVALAVGGERSGAVQSLQDAARAYRARGEVASAERAELAAGRLTS